MWPFKPNIKKLEAKHNVKKLLKIMYNNYYIRSDIIEAIGRIGNSEAFEALIKLLNTYNDLNCRRIIAQAFTRNSDLRAIEQLKTLLYDSDNEVRNTAALGLENFNWKPGNDSISAEYFIIKKKFEQCVKIGVPSVQPLINALLVWNLKWRNDIINALIKIGEPAVELLITVLKDYNPEKQYIVIEVLGEIGGQNAVGALVDMLEFTYLQPSIRSALQKSGAMAIDPLIRKLEQENKENLYNVPGFWERRDKEEKVIIEILAEIGDVRAAKALIIKLKNGSEVVSRAAGFALVKMGKPVLELVSYLLNDNYIRSTVAEVLDAMGWVPDTDLNSLKYWIAKKDWEECVQFGSIAVEPLIAQLNSYYNRSDCIKLVEALGKLKDPRAIKSLLKLFRTRYSIEYKAHYSDSGMCIASAEALINIGKPSYEYLIENWEPYTDIHEALCYCIQKNWELCAEVGIPAIKPLIFILSDEASGGDGRTGMAMKALAKIGDKSAIPSILELLKNEFLQEQAAESLDTLGWNPQNDSLAAQYWIVKRLWQNVFDLGSTAVDQLILFLKHHNKQMRIDVAIALVQLYKNGNLTDSAIRKILDVKSDITKKHEDYYKTDCYGLSVHNDWGIGVEFHD